MQSKKDTPDEVWYVWAIKIHGMTGTDGLKRCREIIKKYPEHFPNDVIFQNLPSAVHDAYRTEMNPDWDKPIDFAAVKLGEGIMAEIEKKSVTTFDLQNAWNELLKMEEERKQEEKREIEIWNKHYGKYGLFYQKGIVLIP